MTFVQVKENEWFNLIEGIHLHIVSNDPVSKYRLIVDYPREHHSHGFNFPTLEEAIAAQVRIIESCGTPLSITSEESEKLTTFLRYLREDQMPNKTEGTGLLDDSGKVVKEIKAEEPIKVSPWLYRMLAECPPPSDPPIIRDPVMFIDYQNDNMGCPTEDLDTNCNLEELLKAQVKATKLKRVK